MSERKHNLNEITCKWLKKKKWRPLRILETHQGLGDSTEKYRRYGCVVSFEKDSNTYSQMCIRFLDAISLDLLVEQGQDILDLANACRSRQTYPVVLPSTPTDSRSGLVTLRRNNWKFDIVDIDPYGSPHEFIPQIFDLLDDRSILLITSGEMHYVRFDPTQAMSPYGIRRSKRLRTTSSFFKEDNILVVGGWVMKQAVLNCATAIPVFIFDYFQAQSGVQRIGFWIRKQSEKLSKTNMRVYTFYDPSLGVSMPRCSLKNPAAEDVDVWRFDSNCPEQEIESYVVGRLDRMW